jgi:uncharacterized membrane protein YhaH (DUF805 family)
MFRFHGRLGRKRFIWGALIRIALFAASVAGFPYLLMAVASLTGCSRVGGACGAVGLMASAILEPAFFVVFVFSFIGIAVRRSRDAGMPAWAGLFIPLLLASDYVFLVFAGTPWSFGFSQGVMHAVAPIFIALALGCIAFLAVLAPRRLGPVNPFGPAGIVAAGLAGLITLQAMFKVAMMGVLSVPMMLTMARIMRPLFVVMPWVMLALAAVLAFIAWRERSHADRDEPDAATQAAPDGPPRPMVSLIALATVLTLIVFNLTLPREAGFLPLAVLLQLTSVVVPTFALYFALVFAVYLLAERRTAMRAALVLLALAPFGHWAYASWAKDREIAAEAADVAKIPTSRPEKLPTTLVFESRGTTGIRAGWSVTGIEAVISKGAYSSGPMQFVRPVAQRSNSPQPIGALPDEYLLLKVGRDSTFAKREVNYAAAGGPLELRLIGPQRNDLLAVSYRKYDPPLARWPVLASHGWLRPGSNSATTDEIEGSIRDFLTRALAR